MTTNKPIEEKEKFVAINVKENVKKEIDILATVERRHVYEVVEQMLELYKSISYGKTSKKSKKLTPVSVAEIVADH